MGLYQAVTSLVSYRNVSLSGYAVSVCLLAILKMKKIFNSLSFVKTGDCVAGRAKTSMSSAVLASSRGLTPARGLWGAPGCAREPQWHRQSCRTCRASSSWWHCLVFNPALDPNTSQRWASFLVLPCAEEQSQ